MNRGRVFNNFIIAFLAVSFLSACDPPTSRVQGKAVKDETGDTSSIEENTAQTPTSTSTLTVDGIRAVRIVMHTNYQTYPDPPNGSFQSNEVVAKNFFAPDNSTLSAKPDWLLNFSVGTSNSHAECAKFGRASQTCDADGQTATTDDGFECGLPQNFGWFNVSEYDCEDLPGEKNGEVFINIDLDRKKLASYENLLMVVEYIASAVNAAPSDPAACFTNGVFNAANSNCTDLNWQIYLGPNAINPFYMLAPPSFIQGKNTSGNPTVVTKQIQIPLAAHQNVSQIKIARMNGTKNTTHCVSGSPLCIGMVFYNITLFRD